MVDSMKQTVGAWASLDSVHKVALAAMFFVGIGWSAAVTFMPYKQILPRLVSDVGTNTSAIREIQQSQAEERRIHEQTNEILGALLCMQLDGLTPDACLDPRRRSNALQGLVNDSGR